jgi:hypothetical protein
LTIGTSLSAQKAKSKRRFYLRGDRACQYDDVPRARGHQSPSVNSLPLTLDLVVGINREIGAVRTGDAPKDLV